MAVPKPVEVRRIFEMALERPAREREFFIARACGEDRILRDEVARLLGIDGELVRSQNPHSRNSRLERPDDPGAEPREGLGGDLRDPYDAPDADHRRIGRYQLLRRLGEGGSSTVFLGRRHDTDVAPEVAIKILRTDLPPIAEQRFALEQRILADLEHPNIARFLDSGVEDGRHFVVLEKVEGSPITEHCDARCLGLDARIQLLRTLCDAVAAAHRHLVVHRDLKPGNLLVSAEGMPKVLDFGIAKILDGSGDETLPQHRALTPNYASPEQWCGKAVTTVSDVYSLGVVLYEMLSGFRPFDRAENPDPAAEPWAPSRAVAVAEPVQALAAATARSLDRPALEKALTGDLDTIALKALRPDAAQRYPSVEHLSEDLRRFLADEPILARPAGPAYRTRKWLRRNRLAGAGLLLSAGLFVALVFTLVAHNLRVGAERDAAEAARAQAQRISTFLVGSFADADPRAARGGRLTMREFLVAAAERLDAELREDPAARADLLHTLGTSLANLGSTAEAEPLLRKALAMRSAGHPDRAATLAELSAVARSQGLYREARRFAEEALALHPSASANDGAPTSRLDRAQTLRHLAMACLFDGEHGEAERHARAALEIERQTLTETHGNVTGVAESLLSLASILADSRRFDEALDQANEGLDVLRQNGESDSLLVAELLQIRAIVYRHTGEIESSLAGYRDLLEIRRRVLGPTALRYAEGLHGYASATYRSGDLSAAREILEEVVTVYRNLDPPSDAGVGLALEDLGELETEIGDFEAAEKHLREALEIRRRVALDRPDYVLNLAALARMELKRGQKRLASHYLRQAQAALALAPSGSDRVLWLRTKMTVADQLEASGDRASTKDLLESALADAESMLEPGHPFIQRLLKRLDALSI